MNRESQKLSIGWLDFSEEDLRDAKALLAKFNGENTLDELGFGILRDTFAEMFYPATNTVMTRPRYLMFIPALCIAIEDQKLEGRAADKKLTELEDQVRESLLKEETRDVIGKRSKDELDRYPSSIYWNALRRLGVFLHSNWRLAYYQNHLSVYYKTMTPSKDNDGLYHLQHGEQRNWENGFCNLLFLGHSIFKDEDQKIPLSLNFKLTPYEACYLRDRYKALAQKDGRPSMISHLVGLKYPDEFSFPWDVPCPAELSLYVKHARLFSMLTRGATLQYYHLLQRERDKKHIARSDCDFAGVFERWWEATRKDLKQWRVEEFLSIAKTLKGIRRENDAKFIRTWSKLNVDARNANAMFENPLAHDEIRRREKCARPNKARLHFPEFLKRWKPPRPSDIKSMASKPNSLCFFLEYRAGIGNAFVKDIVNGLE